MSLKQRLQATPLMLGENISRLGRGGDRCALRTQQLAGAAAALEDALIQQLCLLIYPELLQGCVDSAAAA